MNYSLLPDIPRLYTAFAEWVACIIYMIPLRKRFSLNVLAFLFPFFLIIQGIGQYIAGRQPILFWIPGMIGNVFIMFLFIYSVCDITKRDAWYCCARAFITAEFVSSLEWQLYCKAVSKGMDKNKVLSWICLIIICGILFLLIYYWEKRVIEPEKEIGVEYREVWGALCMVIVVFSLSNMGFLTYGTKEKREIGEMLFFVRTIVDFCGICVLNLQQKQRKESCLKRELEAIHNVLYLQYEQYKTFKENNEIISRKYHDLKHQISSIRLETDSAKREEYIKEIVEALKRYEAENVTGNAVLDTILTGKNMYCSSHDINLTCVANGQLLDFIEVMDICTIFGNALDNAIEYVKKFKEKEKKLIRVALYRQNCFLILCFENYCESRPDFQEGIPKTTKNNSDYHGYGIKSIRYTVEKYHGTMTINMEQDWFILRILIPLPKEK